MEKEVKCVQLWKSWQHSEPQDKLVLTAESRISKYTKKDWENMIIDAKETMQELSNLVVNNVDIHDIASEQAAIRLIDHVSKHFFPMDLGYANGIKYSIIFNKEYAKFFNQFQEGLADKMVELINTYGHLLK